MEEQVIKLTLNKIDSSVIADANNVKIHNFTNVIESEVIDMAWQDNI